MGRYSSLLWISAQYAGDVPYLMILLEPMKSTVVEFSRSKFPELAVAITYQA